MQDGLLVVMWPEEKGLELLYIHGASCWIILKHCCRAHGNSKSLGTRDGAQLAEG